MWREREIVMEIIQLNKVRKRGRGREMEKDRG